MCIIFLINAAIISAFTPMIICHFPYKYVYLDDILTFSTLLLQMHTTDSLIILYVTVKTNSKYLQKTCESIILITARFIAVRYHY